MGGNVDLVVKLMVQIPLAEIDCLDQELRCIAGFVSGRERIKLSEIKVEAEDGSPVHLCAWLKKSTA